MFFEEDTLINKKEESLEKKFSDEPSFDNYALDDAFKIDDANNSVIELSESHMDLGSLDDLDFEEFNEDKAILAEDTDVLGQEGKNQDRVIIKEDVLPEDGISPSSPDYMDEDKEIKKNKDFAEDSFVDVLKILKDSEDLGVDSITRTRILELEDANVRNPLILKQLQNEHLISSRQIGRAVARSMGRLEVINFQDVPASSMDLKKDLDTRVQLIMRELRVLPIRKRMLEDGAYELHLAYDSAMRNVILESRIKEIMPRHRLCWHYATREVCGQFWVVGDEGAKGSVDSALEAEGLLDRIISDAIDAGSSDIHIDPSIKGESIATIKYRIDGFIKAKETINLDQLERLRVRIENISRMPSVNLSHPNKGAFTREGFDWRVQIQPHAGRRGPVPRIVIRRLQPDTLPLETLGYPAYFIEQIKAASLAPNGVIFWTGPTGSGKTESIHSAVVSVDPMSRGLSVHTIEDPIEKRVDGYSVQMELSDLDEARSGLELLKSSLRADPDVVIVGEVRDGQMAQLVFDAANTGHLVFSTLHTNNSIDALVRLDELGVKGFVMSYIRGMVAQRLARRLCNHCKVHIGNPRKVEQKVFDIYKKFELPTANSNIFEANPDGCPNCNHSGYSGRIALAELLVPSMDIIQAITDKKFVGLEELAIKEGWKPMGVMGCEHVLSGITDVAELQRVVLELSGIDLNEE
ncbi:MAG: Flp pilus assembly complex ATPase component [Proteobacteria bacterium]|nr:Flp pilus assembly complex ATPase component [Pseudomonadota bacterium]